jgi:anti-sigma-K factor RskA
MSGPGAEIPEELHVLAGEYVLGALEAAEMRAVRRQAMRDPLLAAAVAGWERRLAPMAGAVPVVTPPGALWDRIEQAIAPLADDTAEAAPLAAPRPPPHLAAVPTPPMPPPPMPLPPPGRSQRDPMRRLPPRPRRVWPWQLATVASLAVAAGIVAVVALPVLARQLHLPMLGERFSPRVAALLPADSHVPGFLAEARPDGTVVLAALAPVDVPAGKALELWILPPGATAPRSLGVLPAAGHRVSLAAMPAEGTALMVSLEPPGGSPTGAPTGPVVYAGKLGQFRL